MSIPTMQLIALFANSLAINLVASKLNNKWRVWGYVVGGIVQPIWFTLFLVNENYLMLGFCVFNIIGWMRGVYNHWFSLLD
jgi:hypothetical protein